MNKNIVLILIGFVLGTSAFAQTSSTYADLITPADLKANLSILASDALEGRETGTRGQKMAAAFIKAHFESLGLAGPVNGEYYQPVNLYTSVPAEIYVKAGDKKFNNYDKIAYYGNATTSGEVSLPVVFAGKGRKEDFDQIQVEGKAVIVLQGPNENFRAPLGIARERKAQMVFICNTDTAAFRNLVGQFKSFLGGGSLSLKKPEAGGNSGVMFIHPQVAEAALKTTLEKLKAAADADLKKAALKKFKPGALNYKTTMEVKSVRSDNVLGFLEGTDKKDEVIVITSHYDHIGISGRKEGDKINNGADDDGSGTVGVLQLATAFAKAKAAGHGPRRSILFMTVTGEEKGLLGSEYYSENPIFPLDKTVVDLNIDMIGRRDPQHENSAPYVYVIGSDKLSTELHTLSETVNNNTLKLVFDYTYNDQNHPERLYYRSDHWNFAKKNIPIIFYFDGIHADYHQPSDEVDKIEFDLLAKRVQVVFYTAWEIANREKRIVPDEKK